MAVSILVMGAVGGEAVAEGCSIYRALVALLGCGLCWIQKRPLALNHLRNLS